MFLRHAMPVRTGVRSRHLFMVLALSTTALVSPAFAGDLPTGGQIVAGSGSIATNGATMDITQNTHAMAADWQSFSIGNGHTVNFHQPSSNSVALNRVLGNDVSDIRGNLNANGQVFLVNPNGVMFGENAQVNVGGLVASTQDIDTNDFMAGRYTFDGDSNGAVINEGNIRATNGGTVALVAAKIINHGTIVADEGAVLMGAGKRVTVDMGGPVKLSVEEGAIDTLIEQGGAVRANGGEIYMTTKAAGDLASSVINHTGITEAQTLGTGKSGKIVLIGDMKQGRTIVSGKLDASAPVTGNGGFIETSAATVETKDGLEITAAAASGKGGEWLIDPYNYVIDATAATNIVGTLNGGTDVTVTTAANVAGQGSSGNNAEIGDITVASAINKTGVTGSTLTLRAANSIILDAQITSTNSALNLVFDADNDSGTRDGGGVEQQYQHQWRLFEFRHWRDHQPERRQHTGRW